MAAPVIQLSTFGFVIVTALAVALLAFVLTLVGHVRGMSAFFERGIDALNLGDRLRRRVLGSLHLTWVALLSTLGMVLALHAGQETLGGICGRCSRWQ